MMITSDVLMEPAPAFRQEPIVDLAYPLPGSAEELMRFAELQRRLAPLVTRIFPKQQGVVFHLIGALSEYGKLGTVCIGDSRASAERFFHDTVAVLNRETGARV